MQQRILVELLQCILVHRDRAELERELALDLGADVEVDEIVRRIDVRGPFCEAHVAALPDADLVAHLKMGELRPLVARAAQPHRPARTHEIRPDVACGERRLRRRVPVKNWVAPESLHRLDAGGHVALVSSGIDARSRARRKGRDCREMSGRRRAPSASDRAGRGSASASVSRARGTCPRCRPPRPRTPSRAPGSRPSRSATPAPRIGKLRNVVLLQHAGTRNSGALGSSTSVRSNGGALPRAAINFARCTWAAR